jgi:DNA-binding GntR family transcriptional regulator
MSPASRPFATKTEWVYERLREQILDGSFKPDDRLRLTELARRFEISEMPVREALRMLQRDGLIEFHSHRGAVVVNLSWSHAADIIAVRTHLEVLAIGEAAMHHTLASLAGLRRIVAAMDGYAEADQPTKFSQSNRAFHTALYAPCPNKALTQEIQSLWDRVWRARAQSIFDVDRARMMSAQAEHRALLAAVETLDSRTAIEAMTIHRDRTLAAWRAVVERMRAPERAVR